MAKKPKKRKPKKPETEYYGFDIEDWEADYSFGRTAGNYIYYPADNAEHSTFTLLGRVIAPVLKNAIKVCIRLCQKPVLDEHWKEPAPDKPDPSI